MSIIVGSARIDERSKLSGGKAGDQKQKSSTDCVGEVSMQNFYVHKKGWYVLRPKDAKIANEIAQKMITACNNKNLGYDQSNRLGVITYGVATTTPTECDCSALVRACVQEATGMKIADFTTANELAVLKSTGLFETERKYTNGMTLYTGDILITCVKGHTAIVTNGTSREAVVPNTLTVLYHAKVGNFKNPKSTLTVHTKAGAMQPVLKEWPKLGNGNDVDVIKNENGWSYIRIAAKYYGWVSSKYLIRV